MPGVVLGLFGGFEPRGLVVPIANTPDYAPYTNSIQTSLGGFALIFPTLFARGVGLSFGLGYAEYRLHATGSIDTMVNVVGGNVVQGRVDAVYDAFSPAVQGELQAYFQIGDVARLEVGPWGGVGFIPSYVDTQRVVAPAGATFSDGLDVHTESAREQNSVLPMTGAMIRFSAEIPLIGGTALLPSLFGRAGVVLDQSGLARAIIMNAGVGFGLLFSGTNGEVVQPLEPIVRVDTVVVPSAPPVSRLRATIDLFRQDGEGHRADTLRLTPRLTLHRLEVPLVPVVGFEKNSAALSSRYVQYTADTRSLFSFDSLAGGDVTEFSRQALNILGRRLVDRASAHLLLRGRTSKGEPSWFAEARARTIREYLVQVWGISENRISVETARDGARSGERIGAVEMSTDEPELFRPVVSEWVEQELGSTPIGLEPKIQTESGVREWRVSVLYSDRELATIRQSDSMPSSLLDAGMLLNGIEPDLGSGTLEAELVVEDSAGATMIARDTMPVVFARSVGTSYDYSLNRYILLDVPATISDPSLRKIADSIHEGAVVSILPLSSEGSAVGQLQQRLIALGDELQKVCRENGVTLKDLRIHERASDGHPLMSDDSSAFRPVEITVSQPYSEDR